MFWLVYLSFNVYQITVFQRDRGYDWVNMIKSFSLQLVITMIVVYYNYFLSLPRFLKHKRIWKYLFEFIPPFVALIVIRVFIQRWIVSGQPKRIEYFYSDFYIVQIAAVTLLITIFIGMFRFAFEWFEFESRQREAENQKLTNELNFLKAQINPHFLFNTLNNLYYLAYSKSDNTTGVIARLSQMMRYMIDDSNHQYVPLEKEIEYMKNYISLEELRLNNSVPISVDISGEIASIKIAPLILITFLENAFKHGVSANSADAWVKMSISVVGSKLQYTVENSKPASAIGVVKNGIGLQNVYRRLELMYPGKHELLIEELANQYRVSLILDLS